MSGNGRRKIFIFAIFIASSLLLKCPRVQAQNAPAPANSPGGVPTDSAPDIRALADSVRTLQAQVQSLNSQVSELRAAEEREHAEARELRSELNRATAKVGTTPEVSHDAYVSVAPGANASLENTASTSAVASGPASSAPSGSSAGFEGSRDVGIKNTPATSAKITIGTFTQKIEPQ